MDNPLGTREFRRTLRNLARSGLIASEELNQLVAEFNDRPAGEQMYPAATTNFGHWLIGLGRLTCWQYSNVCAGRWKGFFLDGYKLLDHLEVDDDFSYYLAEEVGTGLRVALRVTPRSLSVVPDATEYKVVHEFR